MKNTLTVWMLVSFWFLHVPLVFAKEVVIPQCVEGKAIIVEDFENWEPKDKLLVDENREGYWNIRVKTWIGGEKMLNPVGHAPDITCDPKLNGYYDLYVGLRSVNKLNSFGIKLSSENDFTYITAPFARPDFGHNNYDFCWRRNVKMDGQKITVRSLGCAAFIDHLKFVPLLDKKVQLVGETVTVCRDDSKHFAFPGVAQAKNGDILAVWREGTSHVSDGDYGKISLTRSKDNGKTWGKRVTIYSREKNDERDPSILCLTDGALVLTFADCDTPGNKGMGSVIMRSYDNGYTWDNPTHAPVWSSSKGICEDSNGHLYYLGLVGADVNEWKNGYVQIGCSTDHGKTWKYCSTVTKTNVNIVDFDPATTANVQGNANETFYDEPSLVILPGGKWIAMFRTDVAISDVGFLRQFTSIDNGKSWKGPITTPMWGFPCHLLCLKNGDLLCTYGYRQRPFGIRGCLSHNKGQTWDINNELVLQLDAENGDLGYPESIQLADGTIFTLYYTNTKESNCFIGGNFYRVD